MGMAWRSCMHAAMAWVTAGADFTRFTARKDNATLAPWLGAMVGGKYYLRSYMLNNREFFEKWRETGRRHCRKQNDKSVEGWVSFDFVTDLQNYDMVFDGGKIKAATLLVTGEKDLSSTVYNNERMYAALTAPKELVVIKDCPHTFDSDQNRKDLREALDRWLKTKV